MAYEQLKLDNQLCFPIYAVSRLITKAYQEDLDKLGITYPQYLVLLTLWEYETAAVNQIAERLYLQTNTITPLLKRMESMGLISRNRSSDDERKVMVTLTQEGKDLEQQAAEIPSRLVKRLRDKGMDISDVELLDLKNKIESLICLLA
ncbi:MAG: MarR family winged helix-turn-helix transcriptional regulator [Bacteroidales bacterium]